METDFLSGLALPGVPGALASLAFPGAASAAAAASRLGFHTLPGGHCVMLVSNLNPEVSRSHTSSDEGLYFRSFERQKSSTSAVV